MADATDVVLSLLLTLKDEASPAMTVFNGRLAEQKTLLAASSARMAEAGAASEAMSAKQAAAAEASYLRQEKAGVASYERQQIAASKEAAAAEAAYLRQEAAGLRAYEREQVAAEASYQRQVAAAEAASARQSAALVKVGKAAGLLTLGIVGIAYETSKLSGSFQRDMEQIRTQAGASQGEVNKMTNSVEKLSGQVGTGPDQLAQSLFHVESAGARGAKALDEVRLAAEGARVGNANLETTTNAMIGVMVSGIRGIRNATDAMAALNSIVGLGNVRMQDLTAAIGTGVLPSFANFGLGIRDFAAAESTLTDNSFGADEAATKLRMSVSLIGAPSGAAAKALEAIGLSASEANAQLKDYQGLTQYGIHLSQLSADLRQPDGLLVALKDLKTHLEASGLSATEQGAVIARAFGGGRSGAAIETLYQQIDRLQNKYDAFGAGVKKWGDDWNATTQTTAFQAAQAKANVDALGISVGQGLVPAATEFLKVITPAAEALARFAADHKTLTSSTLIFAGAAAGVVATVGAVEKLIVTYGKLKLAAESARVAQIAAFAASPPGIAIAITALAAYEAKQKTVNDNLDAMKAAEARLTTEFDKGNISTDQAKKILAEFGVIAKLGTGDVVDLTLAKLEDSKIKYQDHITLEANALHHLGTELTDSVGYWHAATAAKKGYYQFDGKGAAALSPGASDPKAGPAFDFQKQMTHATAMIDNWASKVIEDTQKFGAHSAQTAWATQMLDKWRATSATLDKEWQSLTGTTVKLKTAGLDPFTKGFQDAQKRLSDATAAIANDYVKGIPVSAAQRKAFDDATASVKRYQAAQDAADGTTAAREKARQDKADAAQKAAWAKIDKGLDAQATKQEALAVAAEKAYKALLDVAHASELVAGNQGAEAAHRAGLYNPNPGRPDPSGYKSYGAYETAAAAYDKAHSMGFYHQFPSAAGTLTPGEMKIEGITPAQLLADPNVKAYLETLTDKKLKALGFTPGQIAALPGTDAYNAKQSAGLYTTLSGSPDNNPGGGPAKIVPGAIHGVGDAFQSFTPVLSMFDQLVKAGKDAIASQEVQTHANYQVAKDAGDTATEFSILDTAFLAGKTSIDGLPVTIDGVVQAYKDNEVTVLAATRNQIEFDKRTGNTADEFAKTQELYHQGNASLAELTQAYDDNQAAVARTTAQDLAFLVSTGQWTAALSSISTSLTGPLGDATAKLTYDFYSHSGNIEADTKAVQDHQAALDALTQATWDASYTAANPAQQSQMLNTLAQPMIAQQSSEASAAQAMNTAQLGVIAAESALEVQGINAMTTELADMGGIIKAASALQTAQFSGQLAALNDLIPIQNDMAAIQKATTPQMLQTAQEQLKIDRLTAAMDQNKASWDVKIAQMTLQLAQDKMMVDMANADAQRTIAVDNLVLAGDALNVQIASAKLQSDSLVIQNAIHTDLGGVQDYLSLIDGDLQNLTDAQNQQMTDQGMLASDTGYANMLAASGAAMLGGDQLGIDSATAAATAANQAYQLQLAQYKVEQNSQQNLQQLVANSTADNAALLSEVKTLQNLIAFQNSPASRRPLRSVGNVSTAAMINSWAATAAATQAA